MTVFAKNGFTVSANFIGMEDAVRVATHNGLFHGDDVVAIAILAMIFGNRMEVVRTRDPEILAQAEILVDVGGAYDGERYFDHHQSLRGIGGMAAAGLVWQRFGKDAIASHFSGAMSLLDDISLEDVVDRVKENMINNVDAIDIGGRRPAKGEYTFSHFISGFNTPGKAGDSHDFANAVEAAMGAIGRMIFTSVEQIRAERPVVEAIKGLSPDDNILILNAYALGAMNVVQKANDARAVKLQRIVYPDVSGSWRVQKVEGMSDMPSTWWGKRDQELDVVTGIEGGVFVHANGFIGGNKTREGAIAMAKASI